MIIQVLFKRKPVQFLPQPAIEDDSSEVSHLLQGASPSVNLVQIWIIPETSEIFLAYEDYLQRCVAQQPCVCDRD